MSSHETCPYRSIQDDQRWDRAQSEARRDNLDPHELRHPKFRFGKHTPVMTAGSCFAQNISQRLKDLGYRYLQTEYNSDMTADENRIRNNDIFSARYGNIYTAHHFEQLIGRAFGKRTSADNAWHLSGRFFDPCRPSVDPEGFPDLASLQADRERHLTATRSAFETADILIFTLGLTEAWVNAADESVYPICPGCGFGTFNSELHKFRNYSLDDIVASLERALDQLAAHNPKLKVILTVSPIPLAATMEPRHVLTSTVYSKSVLRVAAETVARRRANVDYFAAYEIVNWGRRMSSYFEGDLRSVSDSGIDHVMRVFFRHYCDEDISDRFGNAPRTWCDEDRLIATTTPATGLAPEADIDIEFPWGWIPPTKVGSHKTVFQERHPNPFTAWKSIPRDRIYQDRVADSFGYYNAHDIADYSGSEHRRICVIGSSFVMDLTLDHDKTVCSAMQRRIRDTGFDRVIVHNCGITGSVSSQDLSSLVHHVVDLNPNLVVVITGGNDMPLALLSDPRPGYPVDFYVSEFVLGAARVRNPPRFFTANRENLSRYREYLRKSLGFGSAAWLDQVFSMFQRNVDKIRGVSRGYGIPCLIVNQVTKFGHLQGARGAAPDFGEIRDYDSIMRLDAFARSTFFKTYLPTRHQTDVFSSLDLTTIFGQTEQNYFVDDRHLTADGYDVVGRRIVDHLIEAFPSIFRK